MHEAMHAQMPAKMASKHEAESKGAGLAEAMAVGVKLHFYHFSRASTMFASTTH